MGQLVQQLVIVTFFGFVFGPNNAEDESQYSLKEFITRINYRLANIAGEVRRAEHRLNKEKHNGELRTLLRVMVDQ